MGKDRLEILSELIQVIGVITDGTKYYGHTTLSELSETETTPTEDVETTVDNSSLWQEVTDIKEGMGKVYATLTNLLKSIHEIEDGLIDHKSKIEDLNDVYNKSFDKPKAKKGQDQVSKKRGPYKKKRKKSVSKVKPIEPTTPSLGIRTISKFSKKIEYSLNNSKHFSIIFIRPCNSLPYTIY